MRNLLILSVLISTFQLSGQVLWQINKDTTYTWFYNDGDEFNDSEINMNEWNYWFGWGRSIISNKEQQYYTNGENHFLSNGELHLYAQQKKQMARYVDWMNDKDSIKDGSRFYGYNLQEYNYTSGMLQSKRAYQYGYFEIKFKTPKEKGFWPAFWLYGGSPNEEIDWMELKTEKDNQIHVGRHSQKREENKLKHFPKKRWWGDWLKFKGSFKDGYNIIAGEWTPEYLKYYLNGECIAYTKLKMVIPKNLVVNLAVPGVNGSFKPAPDTSVSRSSDYVIDYVRVWSKNPSELHKNAKQKLETKNAKVLSTDIAVSKLKTKGKFHYGAKSIHENEGITVSLLPVGNDKYELTVLGKVIPKGSIIEIISKKGDKITSELKYGSTQLDFSSKAHKTIVIKVPGHSKPIVYDLD